jgi:mediator of RNA polymerase II transcription subunit 6
VKLLTTWGYLVLFYFAESPFFDPTSNNASLAIQASYNEAFRHFVETREAFEARLKTMSGLEFIVAYDPLQAAAQTDTRFAHEPSNVWVIRKQNRRKRTGMDDEVTVISTYFLVGDCIYMAPSVASVVGNRIVSSTLCYCFSVRVTGLILHVFYFQLSAVTSLSRLMKTASTLPTFTPSYGHTYLPPMARPTTESGAQASQQSKENTPMPDAAPPSTADTQGTSKAGLGISNTHSSYQDTRSLAESFSLFTQYGDEFMDETPLVGEPGSFIMSRVGGENDRAAKNAAASKASLGVTTSTPGAGRVSTPQVRVDTPGKASEKSNSPPSSGENKGKRKKNRVAS